jgi:hypothetical protein
MAADLPIESIAKLDIQPGETLVVRMHRVLSEQERHEVHERVRPCLPDGVRVLVLGSGIELTKLAAGNGDRPPKN